MINEISIVIWNREFVLPVEFRCYDDEPVTEDQINAVKALPLHPDWIENAKKSVEQHCSVQVAEDSENSKKDNIFSYIKPDYLFVRHEKLPRVALMCKYRYDMEHGLAIVFSVDGNISVGPQDIIL